MKNLYCTGIFSGNGLKPQRLVFISGGCDSIPAWEEPHAARHARAIEGLRFEQRMKEIEAAAKQEPKHLMGTLADKFAEAARLAVDGEKK